MPRSSAANDCQVIIVMPVYEDRESASLLLRDIARYCPERPYVIAVEDGSLRDPLPASAIADAGLSGEVITLARNMGHQRAIAVGICYVSMEYPQTNTVIVLDSDGEDRPQAIAPMLAMLREGNLDVVVAERRKRSEPWRFRIFYSFYRIFFQTMTGHPIRFGNFSALSMRAVRRLAAMQELWVHVAASIIVSRLRVGRVPTDRGVRYAGRSQMNFVSLAVHGFRSMMVMAEDVLVRVGLCCSAVAVLAVALLVTSLALKLSGHATPGWFTAAAGILTLVLMQAAVLTFVTLMIAGIIRGAPPITRAVLDQLINSVETTCVQQD